MSFETSIYGVITKIRTDIRELKASVAAYQASNGTAAAATETVPGVLEIATQGEVDTAVDNAKAVTPLKLQARLVSYIQPLIDAKTSRTPNLVGFGQLEGHGTYTDFNSIADFGWHYVQGSTNGPGIAGGSLEQYYCLSISLGSEYNFASYACQIAYKRGVSNRVGIRYRENGTWGAWGIVGNPPSKAEVGLGNVDNTSDAAKPVSTAQQTALNLKANLASPTFTGTPSGPTPAAGNNSTQFATTAFTAAAIAAATPAGPPASTESVSGVIQLASQAETDAGTDDTHAVTPLKFQTRLAAFAQPLNANLTTLAGVVSGATGRSLLAAATAATAKTALSLVKADVGLGNVDNTSDANKPMTAQVQAAFNAKADLASPSLTGLPTAPTAASGTNNTQIATTAFVTSAVANTTAGTPTVIDGGIP